MGPEPFLQPKVGQASRLSRERVSASNAPASPARAGETPALLFRRPVVLKIIGAAAVALFLVALGDAAEDFRGRGTGIRFNLQTYEAPNRGQVKLLLEAPQGDSMPDSQILLTEAKLKTFTTNGVLENVAETPQCVFDYTRRTVSSAGPLFVHTADGKSWMQGIGFWLQLTNSHFIISNQVHIVIRNKSSAPVFR